MSKASKRIQKEFSEINQKPPHGMNVDLGPDGDLYKWIITMTGPQDSPYAVSIRPFLGTRLPCIVEAATMGGKFKIQVSFPSEYPFKPPKIHWQTKIYHPNVSSDDKGYMCLGMLRDGEWKPNTMMSAALEYIRQLLVEPDPEDSTEGAIAQQYKEDRKEFNKQAKKWTKDHAK
ncbi:MAG: hypothetical protein L6R39_006136 [Caloplaca ligustica]|nr:MAG: hypothetical protein L6R39_006136 [Caloplaca ligustica]